jgi:murein DD-endopeptidase MepM/ murein hydrolase activator NlpD
VDRMSYLDLDFKSAHANKTIRSKRRIARPFLSSRVIRGLTALVTLISTIFLALSFLPDSIAKVEDSNLKQQRLHYSVLLPEKEFSPLTSENELTNPANTEKNQWERITIKAGDTLASIFNKAGLSASITYNVVNLNEQTRQLARIKPGQDISLLIDESSQLTGLKYMPDETHTLIINRQQDNTLKSEIQHRPLEPIPAYKSGTITSSLFEAAAENGISENIIMELAAIFGWDIDFALDIRKGDQFSIVYNELYRDGAKIRDGDILAAEFINQGKQYQAVHYTDPKGNTGYFSPDGKSMRKAFLRTPVKFSHISSRFTLKRFHPILSKWRSHKGVDYAAARGTPVRASGDGKISFRGKKSGYGNTIMIKHGAKYTTVYAHMSRFAKGIKNGTHIKQGQVIGYVGSTGLATGPHLHYEFRVNGVHRNPLTVKLPAAEPINKSYRAHFEKETKSYLSMLNIMGNEPVAQTPDESSTKQN